MRHALERLLVIGSLVFQGTAHTLLQVSRKDQMPNGKGFIDCRYCVYAWPEGDKWPILFGGPVRCLYHQLPLPAPSKGSEHRFCINIVANGQWYGESSTAHIFSPFLRQAARFGAELEPGILYE
jgi:hypothetical protein